MKELINKIKNLNLNDYKTAQKLYDDMCELLKQKYGLVNDDYDGNPLKRGKEWLDIHHIDEISIDDIARRTQDAIKSGNTTTLKILKPFNKKDRLVYSNKIEHFLLHYLIESIRYPSQKLWGGGPHFLWDCSIALKCFKFKNYLNDLCNNDYYQDISLEEITMLYKKLLAFENLDLSDVSRFWTSATYCELKDEKLYKRLLDILIL